MPSRKALFPHRLFLGVFVLALLCLFTLWRRHQVLTAVPFPIDLMGQAVSPGVRLCGFGDLEGQHDPRPYRWGMGPVSQIGFVAPFPGKALLVFTARSPCIPDQGVTVMANGQTIGTLSGPSWLPAQGEAGREVRLAFAVRQGYNTVLFRYTDWNHGQRACTPQDSRRFAVLFTRLAITGVP